MQTLMVIAIVALGLFIGGAGLLIWAGLHEVARAVFQLRDLFEDDMGLDTCHVVESDEIDVEGN